MNYIDRQKRLFELDLAAHLPQIVEGEKIPVQIWALRERKDGNVGAYLNGEYWGTTGCPTLPLAEDWLKTVKDQEAAKLDGILDVRRVSVAVVIEARKKAVVKKGLLGAKVIVSTLKAVEKHAGKLQLRQLTDEKVEEVGEAMEAGGLRPRHDRQRLPLPAHGHPPVHQEEVRGGVPAVRRAAEPKGRTRVVTDAERDRVNRLAAAAFDLDSGLSDKERRDIELAYMELILGMVFGSRPGCYAKLSWEAHDGGGWLDLDGATFHRVPPGTATPSNKLAPPVDIPEEVLP